MASPIDTTASDPGLALMMILPLLRSRFSIAIAVAQLPLQLRHHGIRSQAGSNDLAASPLQLLVTTHLNCAPQNCNQNNIVYDSYHMIPYIMYL